LTHIPTGIVQTAQTRSRENSYQQALAGIHHRLTAQINTQIAADISTTRQKQMGNGSNSNLVRTYCFQHGLVKGLNGTQISTKQFEKGLIDLLW
jgi:protein subunit release factor A